MEYPSSPMATSAVMINGWLRNYIYYSTLIYVFSLLVFSTAGLGLGVRPIELNLILVCLLVTFTRLPKWILWFVLYLTLSVAIGVARGTDAFPWCFLEYRATVISVLYYYYFFKLIKFDSDRAFATYAKFAFWFAVIALPYWAGSCVATHTLQRLRGFSTEPAQFCLVILPAYYWYAYKFRTTRKHALEVAIFTLTVALSQSSLGYVCTAMGVLILLSAKMKHTFAGAVAVCTLLAVAYASSPYVKTRFDQTLIALTSDSDLTSSNLSTYSFISNAIVTQQVLKESALIGNGLGSHPVSHARFIDSIPGVEFFIGLRLESMNALEAGSLTFRVLSEFGILGFLGVLFFVFHFHVAGSGPRAAISNGILVCFVLKLIRSGEYYQPEQFFFIFIYFLNYRKFKSEPPQRQPLSIQKLSFFGLGKLLRHLLLLPTKARETSILDAR
jgi:hypothetical protein